MREMDEYQLWASPTCGGVGIPGRGLGSRMAISNRRAPGGGGRCGGSRVEKKGLDLDSSERQVDQSISPYFECIPNPVSFQSGT